MNCSPEPAARLVVELRQCGNRKDLQSGKALHSYAQQHGLEKNIYVATTLISMYSKCGSMAKARKVFANMIHRNVVSWTSLLLGYVNNRHYSLALDVFNNMDCQPDHITLVAALKACAGLATKENKKSWKEKCRLQGSTLHAQAKRLGFDKDVFVTSILIDMYAKCGDMIRARCVFDETSSVERNVVWWNALISGYVENGQSSTGLDVFHCMDCTPNFVTFAAALKACAALGALEIGQRIHRRLCECGLERNEMLATCLVDFYGKCGFMAGAEEVFNRTTLRDIVSWTALIGGYSLLGDTSQVFRVLRTMQEEEPHLQINSVTMLLVLSTCSHAGNVEEGEKYFEIMSSRYGINPNLQHYSCMVDMLGRANRLEEALLLIHRMPFSANSIIWTALLGACRKWGNVRIGEIAFDALVNANSDAEEDEEDEDVITVAYVLMRNIYQSLSMQREEEGMEARMKLRAREWKIKTGQTHWCDVHGKTHTFLSI